MDYGPTIFLLTGALVSVAQTHQYHFVSMPLNWTEAQHFCREAFTDLATIENTANVTAVLTTTSSYSGKAWIGLYDDLLNSWRWSLNDSIYDDQGGQQNCTVLFGGRGTWGNMHCSLRRPFICYTGMVDGTRLFVKINRQLNWTEAQTYCRLNYVDLASVQNESDNAILTYISSGESVWIGFPGGKLWSDGSTSLFRHWAFGEPDSVGEECITTTLHGSGEWSDEDCSLSFPFICHSTIADGFTSVGQDETSITLLWNTLNNVSFILQFNGTEINITAPDGDGPVAYTVSSLTAGTKYTFTLFSVFESVRSSGVSVTAVTATGKGPYHIVGLNLKLKSLVKLSDSDIESALLELVSLYGLPPQVLSVKVKYVKP
uniref:L-selectin-like isoform X4 n=1 Tax=Solea senegalensis TaxID=28829 RepID=UPI001CD904E1|nr:L-selectin-like isoform X4 [Solea senegalensis]